MNLVAINPDCRPGMVCVVVGLGLLGASVWNRFRRSVPSVSIPPEGLEVDWKAPGAVSTDLLELVGRRNAKEVELIWCAGRAGFLAGPAELRPEFTLFESVVSALQDRFGSGLTVNLLSSAGGIYEATGFVCRLDDVGAVRPYGTWKLKLERLLAEADIGARIFRLSSAYGPVRPGQRTGFVNVLLERALDGGVAQVYASPTTLRDYVFSGDVAKYVVDAVMGQRDPGTEILASGRSTSVDGLIKMICSVTRKRVRVHYRNSRENAADMVFSRSVLPRGFVVSPLEETVRLLSARKRGGVDNSIPAES